MGRGGAARRLIPSGRRGSRRTSPAYSLDPGLRGAGHQLARHGDAASDRAKNVLELLVGEPELRSLPIIFVCHSLGGLLIKQVLRAADGRRDYDAEARAFVEQVKGIVFIATPHSARCTPSCSTSCD